MKMTYVSPLLLAANGTITLTSSQLKELGCDANVINSWEAFWAENEEIINELHPDFSVNDDTTWPGNFRLNDQSTWEDNLIF